MTLPEKGMVNILTELGLTFQSQLIISSFIYDFYVPEFNLIIEVDGDYYHGNPAKYARHELNAMQKKNRRRDRTKTKLATQSNYDLLRFWETDINASPDIVRDTIHKFLNEKHGH
jgi:very-short-patch-repair endonuclease